MLVLALALAGAAQLSRKERASPKGLYEAKCSKCHRLYEPKDYSGEEWQLWMTNMSQKAKLTAEQERLVIGYLEAYRGGNKP
jgi:hypothetical protein